MDNLQLEINFSERRNRFRDALNAGEFVLLVENSSPGRDNDPAASADRLAALENAVLDIKGINASLAITDRCHTVDVWRAAEYASALSAENRDRHVIYLSGRDTTLNETRNLIDIAANAGNCNIVPASGSVIPGDSVRESRKRTFTESIEILQELASHPYGFFSGATVNPYQYTGWSLMGQYFKLVKKLNSGASFLVTQAGWDMLKLQSLRWYLTGRSLFYPMIARLILLTPEKVERILAGEYPGISISHDFQRILEKELHYSNTQFEAAQYRRLELQAAGCRLLGFSGIQLAGVEQPGKAKIAAERIVNALREFTDFDHWLEEYNSYLARTEMAPFSSSFYLYDRTLRRPYPENDRPIANELDDPMVSGAEKLGYNLRKFLFVHADRQKADHQRLFKKLFAGCRSCDVCRLPATSFVCTENCPKRLANGPCGGVKPNGNCEISNSECIHCKVVRLADWAGELPKLEDHILPPGIRRIL
ncbi:methylenetetrahydrofolate reductase C-terminal domain-containing protein [Victivallis vadensis]|uniref:Methylene-tetrahydrofolate reductase C-terminal-like domain-containing protein n=3 Tax=Victivallis TaxID=172900 RepID=A0A848AYR4_9BACT|nr:methylenetetrahydrofolate reductase C-terminal domain-containing protein [Victivallis vadensis]NMD87523.1 hypothetical protein [Victivallis vadensis]